MTNETETVLALRAKGLRESKGIMRLLVITRDR